MYTAIISIYITYVPLETPHSYSTASDIFYLLIIIIIIIITIAVTYHGVLHTTVRFSLVVFQKLSLLSPAITEKFCHPTTTSSLALAMPMRGKHQHQHLRESH